MRSDLAKEYRRTGTFAGREIFHVRQPYLFWWCGCSPVLLKPQFFEVFHFLKFTRRLCCVFVQPLLLPLHHSHFQKRADHNDERWNNKPATLGEWNGFFINLSRIINGAVKKLLFINIPVKMKMCFVTHEHPFWSFMDLSSIKKSTKDYSSVHHSTTYCRPG